MAMRQNEYCVAFQRTFKIRTGSKGQSVRLLSDGPLESTQEYHLEIIFENSQPLNAVSKDQFAKFTSVEEVRQWLLSLDGKDQLLPIDALQKKTKNWVWHAVGREFKISTGTKGQTIRLQPEGPSEQSHGDAFTFRFKHLMPLDESQKDSFARFTSLEQVKQWLLSLGGKEEPFARSVFKKTQKLHRQATDFFCEPVPFIQTKNNVQCYCDRFLPFRLLCMETVHRLLTMQSTAVQTPIPAAKMLFPQRRLGSVRVSEQEARFQFCIAAEITGSTPWAVEVPTTRVYKQKAKSRDGLSGRTDVSFFEYSEKWRRVLNIEFKAGRASVGDFAKDLEQLVREQIPGAWFHLLTRESHLQFAVLNMTDGLKAAIRVPLEKREEIFQVDIDFAICVLHEITSGSGTSVGADLYLNRVKYRRPNPEYFDLEDFDRVIENTLTNPEHWERKHFERAITPVKTELT